MFLKCKFGCVAVPPLPELPDYNELSNGHNNKESAATVEAFNYQVKTPEKLSPEEDLKEGEEEEISANQKQQLQQEDEEEEEDEEANTDNLPSLKLDSLSLYSSDSVSPTCTLSPVADVNQSEATKAPVLCHQVTLEDVSDDSDEECSPKKPKELFIPEGADDFFAIEIVGTPTQQTPNTIPIPVAKPDFAVFQDTPPVDSLPEEQSAEVVLEEDADDDDDFGDFADFSEAPAIVKSEPTPTPAPEPVPQIAIPADDDDGFDDFQDFVTPAVVAPVVEDDDDFGDFSEPIYEPSPAAPIALVTPVLPQPPPPAAPQLSITERVKPLLELMFPSPQAYTAPHPAKHSPLAELQSLHFGAIEQAHALDYQWACSEMRHSLVRSLAIDSRNIVSVHMIFVYLIIRLSCNVIFT